MLSRHGDARVYKQCRGLVLAGIAQRPDQTVVDLRATRGYQQPAVALFERLLSQWLYMQATSLDGPLDRAGPQANMVAQRLRDYQATRLVDGCLHV